MATLATALTQATSGDQPAASAMVALVGVDGGLAYSFAAGTTHRWEDDPDSTSEAPRSAASATTIFDLASVTKLFTAATLLLALDRNGLRDGALVADVLPEFRTGVAQGSTFADLLRHTGGWPAEWPDRRRDPDNLVRFRSARPESASGEDYQYSCVGYIWAGLAIEALTGVRLDEAISKALLRPLGMDDTRFLPPPSLRWRIAATEFQTDPPRGRVHGDVHDETAWALGGVAGNAGLFGTATDLLRFAELLRCGGEFGGRRLLPGWVAEALTTDALPPGTRSAPQYGQALGARVADRAWMGQLAARGAVGHTGFTGTSMLTVPGGSHSVVFLTNRVHPSRYRTDLQSLRSRVADEAARL